METMLLFRNAVEFSRHTAEIILDTVAQGVQPEFREGSEFSSLVVDFNATQVSKLKEKVAETNVRFRVKDNQDPSENVFLVGPLPVLETVVDIKDLVPVPSFEMAGAK